MNESPSTSGSPRLPTIAHFFRWLFSRSLLGCALVGLAGLATLIALVCTEENWRGKRAWERYKHELEAQGEKLDLEAYIPPPVPDEQNFAMTPFLAPLFDFNPEPRKEGQSRWRDTNGFNRANSLSLSKPNLPTAEYHPDRTWRRMTDLPAWALALSRTPNQTPAASPPSLTRAQAATEVLRTLEKYSPILEELRGASQRSYARFNVRYDAEFAPAILLPHLAVMKNAAFLFQLRACAELAQDRTDQAWSDTRMAMCLADTIKDEPFLISKLVQVAIVQLSIQPIWEGLAEHKWSDTQLVEMEQRLGKISLRPDVVMRGERAFGILTIDQVRNQRLGPDGSPSQLSGLLSPLLSGFYSQNQLSLAHLYQQFMLPSVDAPDQRIYPSRAVANEAALNQAIASGFRPYNLFARLLLPAITGAERKCAFGQTRVNEAIVACTLERYRLAQGQFPDSLEPLSPRFLEKLPHDIITGAPLVYHRTPNGQFILYSVGWNEKDDGGMVVMNKAKQPSSDLTQGDWVWQYSAPAVSTVQSATRE
jgi:hypothetical protein